MKCNRPKIRLVSFATPQYLPRQFMLGFSARVNDVVDEVEEWTPEALKAVGFEKEAQGISLRERGSGFWSWKPFVISRELERMNEGDLLVYCDVGRIYPFKLLDQPLDPFFQWMEEEGQDVMPGIEIPWNGQMIRWTKRDALAAFDMDVGAVHGAPPVQASFSIWRVTSKTRALAAEWLRLCTQRHLVSDDPSRCVGGEHPEFLEHRHDQALWTLLCRKRGLRAMTLGPEKPLFDEKHPSEVARHLAGPKKVRLAGRLLSAAAGMLELIELRFRPDPTGNKSQPKTNKSIP